MMSGSVIATLMLFCLTVVQAADDVCSSCHCNATTKAVDCKAKGLTAVPSSFPAYALSIDLSMNTIASVGDKAFSSCPQVKKIDLRHNMISKVGGAAFEGLSLLDTLYLNENAMTDTVDLTSLNNLPSLTHLYMSFNEFTKIPPLQSARVRQLVLDGNKIKSASFPDTFQQCGNLQTIVLSHNQIQEISSTDFKNLVAVKSLNLKLNSLTGIDPQAFMHIGGVLETLHLDDNYLDDENIIAALFGFGKVGNPALLVLSMTNNKITKLTADLFKPFSNGRLRNLLLDTNNIASIDANAFSPIAQSLEMLSMSQCGNITFGINFNQFPSLTLVALNRNHFKTLPSRFPNTLKRLSASGNSISSWPASTFKGLETVNFLDLSQNQLRVVDNDALGTAFYSILTTMTYINLEKNPFNCSCDLANFINWVNTKNNAKLVHNWKNYYCITPTNMAGMLLSKFNVSGCPKKFDSKAFFPRHGLARQQLENSSPVRSDQRFVFVFRVDHGLRTTDIIYLVIILLLAALCFSALKLAIRRKEGERTNYEQHRKYQQLISA